MNKIIAIDGSAGSGKTSISKLFAKTIGYFYLETGVLYRSLTYYFIENKISPKDPAKIEAEFPNIKIDINDEGRVILNGKDIDDSLRDGPVNDQVAYYAQLTEIRKYTRSIQKKLATQRNTVVDGRDIGSVVFPDAFCKFYLEAKTEVRAKRRQEQLAQKGINKTVEEITKEMIKRDYLDRTRNQSPLKIAPDAFLIDTSNLNINDVLSQMINYYNKQVVLIEGTSGDGSNEMLKAISEEQPDVVLESYSKARVVNVGKEIILDIGEKVDAYIDEKEVLEMGTRLPNVGDTIDVFQMGRSSRGVQVSKLKADRDQSRIALSKQFANQELVKGIVKRVIRGGFIIDINGLETFCPYSEYDIVNVNTEAQVDVESEFQILEITSRNIIVSRKRPLVKILDKARVEFFSKISIGDVLNVEIIKLFDYGILAKANEGVNILIRNRDLSWNFFKNPRDLFKMGDRIDVKITNIVNDPKIRGQKRIEASRRELETDPFEMFVATHNEGEVIEGVVKRIESFGAFVELSEGIDGLLRNGDLTWMHRVANAKEVVSIGETIQVKILSIIRSERKIGLGYKQTQPNPWDTMDQQFPVGSVIDFSITSVIQNGLYGYFIDNDQKIESFIHINDTPYRNDTETNLADYYKMGDNVRAKIYAVNKRKQRIELEIKAQSGDAWEDFSTDFKVGDTIKGVVVEFVENGANVKVADDVIGFVHTSQITDKENPILEDELKIGEPYYFVIQLISLETKSLKLSIREYLMSQKNDVKNIMNQNTDTKIKLGDLLN